MRLPDDTQRLTIVGRTGSGKTQAAAWHLSRRRFDLIPWIVYDFKLDSLLNDLPGIEHVGVEEKPPKFPGIYLVHPHPDDLETVRRQMGEIWAQENTGVYVDEGYMVCAPDRPNPAFRTLLTQGRSKHIPIIILSQRPNWLDRFVFSESDFYQVFALQHADDRKTAQRFVPASLEGRLPAYHSYYHDVSADETVVMKPVPERSVIIGDVQKRFDSMKKNRPSRVIL